MMFQITNLKRTGLTLLVGLIVLFTIAACAMEPAAPAVEAFTTSGAAEQVVSAAAVEPVAQVQAPAEPIKIEDNLSAETSGVERAVPAPTVYRAVDLALSDEEAAGLAFMREEEKLAGDVYLALYEMWGLPVFQNIAASEATHTAAVKNLLDRYNLADPAAGNGPGEFTDPDLQALYDALMATGSQSLVDALRVGAAIEEIDILDLQQRIEQTDQADITSVYQNLVSGSENHLRAFVSSLERQGLERQGESYQPQYLSPELYQAIMDGSAGRGSGGVGGSGNRGGGSGYGGTAGGGRGRNWSG